MKRKIDLEKAGVAEAFGALAGKSSRRLLSRKARSHRTLVGKRALGELACYLLDFAKEVGAKRQPVKFGNVSFEVQKQGGEEILSVRKLAVA